MISRFSSTSPQLWRTPRKQFGPTRHSPLASWVLPREHCRCRLKALLGDPEPEVLAQCFSSLLALERYDPVEFIASFLRCDSDDVRLEAVCALAQSRQPDALVDVKRFWNERMTRRFGVRSWFPSEHRRCPKPPNSS